MAIISTHNPLIFVFGLLGNVTSFVVFLAPLPTFVRIWKKKSTEGFQSVPYVFGMLSAMIWLYYATVKPNVFLLLTINSFGCFIETVYIAIFIAFSPKQARVFTLRLLLLLNVGGFCLIVFLSQFFVQPSKRATVLGWVCLVFSIAVFAAPLAVLKQVIKTKSVEFMPFYLSFFLTLSAIMWLFYGLLLKDLFVAVPNILGLLLGVVQVGLYLIYRKKEQKLPEYKDDTVTKQAAIDQVIITEIQIPNVHEQNTNDQANHKNDNEKSLDSSVNGDQL